MTKQVGLIVWLENNPRPGASAPVFLLHSSALLPTLETVQKQLKKGGAMPQKSYCLFCDRGNADRHTIILENDFCYASWDKFPVTRGHLEIIPKDHIVSFFELTGEQMTALYSLLEKAKRLVQEKYSPDGFNIGVNDGEAAGRTIHHLHIHLIPRYWGDVENPRGGIRRVIPEKGDYQIHNPNQ